MRQSIAFPNAPRRILTAVVQRVLPSAILLTLFVPNRSHGRLVPTPVTIPAGTTLVVETVSEVSTKMSVGTKFETRLMKDLHVNGQLVMPAGTALSGVIVISEGGKQFGKQQIATTLNALQWKGQLVPIVSDTAGVAAKPGHGLLKIGGGQVVGSSGSWRRRSRCDRGWRRRQRRRQESA